MTLAFYLSSLVAILATVRVITNTKPIHALLYMVVSLIAVALIFFSLGAPFAGVVEIMVYAGAIMVLFVFAVMMLNLGDETRQQEKAWMNVRLWIGPSLLSALLFVELTWSLFLQNGDVSIGAHDVDAKAVGIALFGPDLLLVELASFLLLAALVAAYHLGNRDEKESPGITP